MIAKIQKSSQKYKITYIIIALNIALYIYCAIIGGSLLEIDHSVASVFGQYNRLILTYGFPYYYYQLFTSMFIHADIIHIAGNMMFLLIFGLRAEEIFSMPQYLGVYLLGGLTGNILTLFFGPINTISVGASGAIFSLFGACIIYNRKVAQQSIIGALIFASFLFLINMGENVNILAHLGGLVFGLAAGYFLALRRKPEEQNSYTINYHTYPSTKYQQQKET